MLMMQTPQSLKIHTLVSLLLLLLLPSVLPVRAQGYLRTSGRRLVNEEGKEVILRGMGLGGWVLQEGYMFQLGNIGQQYRIREKINELVGPEKTAAFYSKWLAWHTRKADIDSLASWGFNSIRFPMHYAQLTVPVEEEKEPGGQTWLAQGFAQIDSLLAWCKANRLYLILDLHAAPGGQGNDLPISDRNPAKPSLWESSANQQKTIALWKEIARRYASEPWIGGYDLINEPNWGFEDPADFRGTAETKNAPLRKLLQEITAAIRSVDQKHLLIIEGNGFGNNYRGILPPWDNNMLLSFHKYGNFNTTAAIQQFLQWSQHYEVPLWLGESGENSNTWFTEAIALAEANHIGWAWWQEKKMGTNNPAEILRPSGYQQLLDYWNGKGPKPDPAQAWTILQDWLELLKIENNRIHRDVIDAMFRQVYSKEAIAFKPHRIQDQYQLIAADYDLGRQRVAYFDLDSASYQYTPGVNTTGNRGRYYRNDGVDIRPGPNGPVLFSIEAGEWLSYTLDIAASGNYRMETLLSGADHPAVLSVFLDDEPLHTNWELEQQAKGEAWRYSSPLTLSLPAGSHRLRIQFLTGGFLLQHFRFTKLN